MHVPLPDLDIDYIANNLDSEGFIPVNSLFFHHLSKNPMVIGDAPVYEKPIPPNYFHIKNEHGILYVDISVIYDESYYKITNDTLKLNIQSALFYYNNLSTITEEAYENLHDSCTLHNVTLIHTFSELTQNIINFLEGKEKTPKSLVDDFLKEQFGDSLKSHPSENKKIINDVPNDNFNISDESLFNNINSDNFNIINKNPEINDKLKFIVDKYSTIYSILKTKDYDNFSPIKMANKYKDYILLLNQIKYKSSNSNEVYDDILLKMAIDIFNSNLSSLLSEFKCNLYTYLTKSQNFLKITNEQEQLEVVNRNIEYAKYEINSFEMFYSEYTKLIEYFKIINNNKIDNKKLDIFISIVLSLIYFIKEISVSCYKEIDLCKQYNVTANNYKDSSTNILETRESTLDVGTKIIDYITNLIEQNFGKK